MFDYSKINKNHRYLLINGPAGSGKDTLAAALASRKETRGTVLKFAKVLKEATHAAHGLAGYPHSFFEDTKDVPNDLFFGKTPREAYIAHSEHYMKPQYGKDVYAKLLVRDVWSKLISEKPKQFYISDSGFIDETLAFAACVGVKNVQMVRIHRDGYGFQGDSRGYVYAEKHGITSFDVHNTDGEYHRMVDTVVDNYFNSLFSRS